MNIEIKTVMGETIEPITNRLETIDAFSPCINCKDLQARIESCAKLHKLSAAGIYLDNNRHDGMLSLVAYHGVETPEEYELRVKEKEEYWLGWYIRLVNTMESIRSHIQELEQLIQKYPHISLHANKERLAAYLKLLKD